jgi:nitric oxide dioxygenase
MQEDLNSKENWLTSFVFMKHYEYETNAIEGRAELHQYKEEIIINDAKYYICGPELFIKKQINNLSGVTKISL